MKLALLIAIISCVYIPLRAQQTVAGRVINERALPAVAVTISLYSTDDSVIIRSVLSGEDGKFQFTQIKRGHFNITVTGAGLMKTTSPIFWVQGNTVVLSDLTVLPESKQLKEVIVAGKRPSLEQHADKLVLNVQNSPLAAGTTAAEILRRVPGVRVTNDRIIMTGKNKLAIAIDGRLSQYQDINVLLKTIPATSIDRIEVMSNPSAKFDAEGDAIINIILKRKKLVGTNGTVGYSTGTSVYTLREVGQGTKFYQRYNPSISINHQGGRISLFANYNYLYRTQFEVNKINRLKEDSYYDQRSYNPLNVGIHTYGAGLDFKIDSSNTIGLQMSGFNRDAHGDYKNASAQSNITNGLIIDTFDSKNKQSGRNNNLAVNLNWRHLFSKKGESLSIDADVADYLLRNTNAIDIQPFRNKKIHHFQSVANPVKFGTLKVDYSNPVGKTSRLETGLKTSFASIHNSLSFIRNGANDPDHSSRFIYQERINAAYANYFTSYGKWDVQAGLRGEQTIANGSSKGQKMLHRNYVQAFPSLLLTRRFDSSWAITGQYSRRIGRPSFQQQNPFEIYLDPLTYTRGNPLLRPQVTNSAKLSLTYTGLPVFVLSYDQTQNVIVEYAPQQKIVMDANGTPRLVSFSVADNLAKANNLSAQLNFPIKAGNVLDGYGGVITTLQCYSAFYQGTAFQAAKWNYTFFAQADLKLSATWAGQFSAYYATASQYEFINAGRNSSVDMGIVKKVMGNKGKISLSVSDLFFCDKTLGKIKYQDIDLRLKQYNDTRNIILSFTYSFGSQHIKNTAVHSIGAEEENKRVKTD